MKILLAYDGSVSSDVTVDNMRRSGLPDDAEALVVCSGPDLPRQKGRLNVLAETACSRIQSQFPQWALSAEASPGAPADVILKASKWWRPDLLIIGAEAFPSERARAASVSLELVHRARCSVRLVRTKTFDVSGPIQLVIGNNGSKACEAVIHEVARRSWPEATNAHVITVVDPACSHDEQCALQARIDEGPVNRLRSAGVVVNRRFITGDPRHELVRQSEHSNADTIFVGARCEAAEGRFLLGSVATAVLTRTRSTVEVVRQ